MPYFLSLPFLQVAVVCLKKGAIVHILKRQNDVFIVRLNYCLVKKCLYLLKNKKMKIQDIIQVSPDVQFGTPVFENTRVPIEYLFEFLEDELSIDQFLEEFPSVRHEQVVQLLDNQLDEQYFL